MFGPTEASGQAHNVTLLLKELDDLREINKKVQTAVTHLTEFFPGIPTSVCLSQLHEQLIHKEEELQRRKVDDELMEQEREAVGSERPAGEWRRSLCSVVN